MIIYCFFSFSRRINGADPSPQDFDLDQSYYLQFGTGDTGRGRCSHTVSLVITILYVHWIQTQQPLRASLSMKITLD